MSLASFFIVFVAACPVFAEDVIDSKYLWRMSDTDFASMESMVTGMAKANPDGAHIGLWQSVQLAKQERKILRGDIGFIVFVSSTCPHCARQKEILKAFSSRWGGWSPFLVLDVAQYRDKAMEYDVTSVPALFIAGEVRGERVEGKVSQGVMELPALEDTVVRAYRAWFKQGE